MEDCNVNNRYSISLSSENSEFSVSESTIKIEDHQQQSNNSLRNTIRKYDQNVVSSYRDSGVHIAWLHIPRSEETVQKVKEKETRSHQIKEFFKNVLIVLEMVTLYKYFVKFPILDLLVPDGTPGVRKQKRIRALSILALIAGATVYACYVALRYCNWETSCFTWDWRFRAVARMSGKMITFFVIIGLILMFRALTSYFHEIPWKVNVGWRRMHIDCMIIAGAWVVVHIIAHSARIVDTPTSHAIEPFNKLTWPYEIYFIVTGAFLATLFLSQYAPYFVLRFLYMFQITSKLTTLEYGMKWWFRHSHKQLFKVIALLYFFHASGDISPFAIYVVWLFCEYQFQLDVTHCTVRFTPSRQKYEYCELITTYANKMPDEFGYYCRVYLLDTFATYTQIPLEDGHTTIFKIKKSIQTDKLLEYVNATYGSKEGNEISLPHQAIKDLNLRVAGPFHSMEMTVKHSLTRHMICLVSGSGKSVSDSVSLFHKSRPGYWNTLTVIQLCGRNKGAEPTKEQLHANISDSKFEGNTKSGKLCSPRTPRNIYNKFENSTHLVQAIEENIERNHVSDKLVDMEGFTRSSTMDVQLWGDLEDAFATNEAGEHISLVQALIQINEHKKDDEEHMKPHFIICSKQWTTKIEPYLTRDLSQRCHIEEFDF